MLSYLAARQVWAQQHARAARAALLRNDYPTAADHMARCLEVWRHDQATLLLAARAARQAGRLQEATRLQDLYRRRHGSSPELALERTMLAVQNGGFRDREPILVRMVAENHPDTPLILEALTQGYIKTVRVPEAFRSADGLLRRQPEHAPALVWRGWAREHLNRPEEALDDYQRAVTLQPEDVWARLCLGEVLLNLQRYPEALEQFQWLRQRQPDDAAARLGAARCLVGVGDVDRARVLLDELATAFPEEGLILSERGRLALEEGQPEEAERWLRRAVSLVPFDRQTHHALHSCLQQQGRAEEAAHYLRQSERLDADLKRLRVLETELSRPGPAADRRCEAGRLCRQLGRPDEAERYLLAALQDDPGHRPAHRALAEHYDKSGRPDLATRHRAAASR